MNISIIDGSNYFKGLLLLIRKDRRISESEIQLMKHIGKSLGFERRFCVNAIHEILENNYIVDAPPEFSTKELAVKFIKDGFAVANSDNEIHSSEKEWLWSVAKKNCLDVVWFRHENENAKKKKRHPSHMEADDLTVMSS